ncbi:cytochrome c oxidase assembly protein [Aureimonas phyllosphaerae]|uniref:Cytochrome c oxidase assembly protein CtaG n=1 Tax=Aureimonas phyllosphaerae TaxID=1166078 RepID=A0A7W6FTI0_9HYPH|nr:cytochrome c oxidase assembly protein [Aureimonas phyllosphaerae]MBB3935026.1 cytochrome c oxidase assembly protein subunit 11 [Aureimonas phyllosphaerae]MBB3959034.1 cytochrome c oxidase assembly protein subunit 11 [Aureimonas phyllosphaerae]SFF08829.1 cytochrome c oxidase assembly protein subunit 11 [Aureimonas phyllosphaerae]
MNTAPRRTPAEAARHARTIALGCGLFVFGMIGAAYASVPLYKLFCQVTGYGGTTQRAESASTNVVNHPVTVRFDANASGHVPWSFQPVERQITLDLGETRQTAYRVRNNSDKPVTAQATFNVTPLTAGIYFNKVQCFCFTEQTLKPGEEVDMPVVFFVDPAIQDDPDLKEVPTITLSYTFFPVADPKTPVAAAKNEGTAQGL